MTSYELIHSKKMVRVWKTRSLLFCLRYDPLMVFQRQNHITFIFIKTMSRDLLVQMPIQGSTQTKPVPAPRKGRKPKKTGTYDNCRMWGCCFKTQFGNFKSGWIKAEDVFVAPPRKRWNRKNEIVVVLDEGETFSTTFSRRAEQRLDTVPQCFRKLEKNWTRQGREWLVGDIWQLANSFHQILANGNCPWLGEAGNSNKYNVRKTDSPYF